MTSRLKLILTIATAILSLSLASTSKADSLFTGPYDVANWTTTLINSDGEADTSSAPASIELTGGNNGSIAAGVTLFSIVAPTTTSLVFDWTYQTFDCCGAKWDPAGYEINGVQTQLSPATSIPGFVGSGTTMVDLNAGDNFGFYVYTLDNLFGASTLEVSGAESTGVPEPSCLALLFAGIIGLGALSLKRGQFSATLAGRS